MKKEDQLGRKIKAVEKYLLPTYGDPFFQKKDPFYVLIATIISQRTKDETTYRVTRELFRRFKDMKEIADADIREIEKIIKHAGFYRQKAKRIKEVTRILMEKYDGHVPENEEKLLSLPGVGRKTANCVLAYGFGKDAIPVDTHVHRISNRIGLVKTKTPEETEEALKKVLPRDLWKKFNITLVRFGQNVCLPLKPRCETCPIRDVCDYFNRKWRNDFLHSS